MEPLFNNGICRCCASEGNFKDFLSSYHWMGEEEIYADMLKDCFSITLTTSDEVSNGGICEVCITQLRNACNFKRQVQQTEEQFKRQLEDIILKSNPIKIELTRDDGDLSDTNMSEDFSANDYEVPIKVEELEEKPKKRQAKASTSRAKKAKTTDGEPSAKRKRIVKSQSTVIQIKIKKEEKKRKRIKMVPMKKLTDYQAELRKHKVNAIQILQHSNATPIHDHTDNGYGCSFCLNRFLDPADLKKHTLDFHTPYLDLNNLEKLVPNDLNKVCVKLDITSLICQICEQNIESIENLIDHLQNDHRTRIFNDITHQILPFKFETDFLECYICKNIFNKFKKLMEHMNIHYKNFLCDVCDAGFVNRRKLYHHKVIHLTGTFSCSQCSKVFSTFTKKRCHERQVHDKAMLVNKCGFCNLFFKNNRQKDKHLVKEHGVTSIARKCQACDKTFVHQNTLMIHMKRHHLVERPHKCSECDKGFFSTSELRAHMVKHTGQREYQCDICMKSYARKWTLHEHMRIHADDRRFKCELCEQAFVQKCSWRTHMRSKHGEQA